MNPIWFKLDRHWYKIAPNSYLYERRLNKDFIFVCNFKFREIGDHADHGMLGINFLQNYVQLHEVTLN